MIDIDGNAGGGQLLRSALTCSVLSGEGIHMHNIRGNRSTPGLRPQHLSCVRLMADISNATVSDVEVGSEALRFIPETIVPGEYTINIGTAGSVTLLFDTVLPLASAIEVPLSITASGGTDVKWSPTMSYFRHAKLPLLRQFGVYSTVDVSRRGFYPAGGGMTTLYVFPSTPSSISITQRGDFDTTSIFSGASESLAEQSVAERQAKQLVSELDNDGIDVHHRTALYSSADSAGSFLTAVLKFDNTIFGFDALGERGTPAEAVANGVAADVRSLLDSPATVDQHMADQLLIFLVQHGGTIIAPSVTDHIKTNSQLLSKFGYSVSVEEIEDGHPRITS